MRARHVMGAVITATALAGCANSPAPTDQAADTVKVLESAAAAQAALPACKDVFVPGKAVDEQVARAGCKSPRDVVQFIGFFECQDGGILFQVDASSGAPNGYGFGGKPYRVVKGESAADKGYKRAYQACHSNEPARARTEKEDAVGNIKVSTPGAAVEVTAGASRVQVSVGATPASTPADPESPAPVEVQVPVPGGEWRSRPSPTPTSTDDPA